MTLSERECIPCRKGTVPLSAEAAQALLKEIPGWHIVEDEKWLEKNYTFKNFSDALRFVNLVGETAERQHHHPDITLGWGYTGIRLQTHAAGGLHENDFILAAKLDGISGI